MFKTLFAVLALSFSLSSFAMTDDESVEFTDAVGKGDIALVKKYLVTYPAAVNEKFFAWSPIQMAATKGQFEMVKFLVEKGADKDYIHPLTKMNAFHLAAFDGFSDIVKYLAAQGADVNKHLKGDISIVRIMEEKEDTKMVELLTSLGVKRDGCQEEKCF
jgi:hypothetical protein